ncbi:hypothetical protein Brms1b_009706 [Colletotrichum noveboracense]|nr:hypothetical protein Brms1b_009706 [Colletotrichum noveboracense]
MSASPPDNEPSPERESPPTRASPPNRESLPEGEYPLIFHPPGAHHFFRLIDAIRSAGTCEAWTMPDCEAEPYKSPDPLGTWGICIVCKRLPTSRKCSKCGQDWVCCRSCEKYMRLGLADKPHEEMTAHVRLCDNRNETTAEIIVEDVTRGRMLTHPQAREDYGFSRCPELSDRVRLFTLYHDLVKNQSVTSEELNVWMLEDTLYESIGDKIHARPQDFSPEIRDWFAENRVIFERPAAGPETQVA